MEIKRKNLPRSRTLGDLHDNDKALKNLDISKLNLSRRSSSQSDLGSYIDSNHHETKYSRKSFDGQGIYEGNLVNGKRDGTGKLISFDRKRVIYEGEWSHDKPHGFGKKLFSNGDQHHGHYRDGIREGWGTYLYSNGDKYQGTWKSGHMHGHGEFIWRNGNQTFDFTCSILFNIFL